VLLVFVVVACMFGMAMAIVDVVHVISVLDLFVGAVRAAVLVVGGCVLGRVVVFVVVAFVFGMAVAIVNEVHVVAVLDRHVRAVRAAVLVLGEGMFSLDFLGHVPSPSRAPEWAGAWLSWLCAMASWITRAT
jgi:hypothetical protein